ncbi:acyl-CoA dehydrogenase family protein [Nocardioides sp.]|uniref:acyl-CoA dehydrogenase family protein n=1 Tax=Nocardioides sp. TaxID=35761 RepID=UPI003D0A4394
MDFSLSPDQQAFRQTVRDFVDTEIRPYAGELERSGTYPHKIVESMKAMDLFGMNVPEEYGGLGLDQVSLAIVFEEIARGWMGVAGILGSHSVTCRLIAQSGTEEQKSELLPQFASGERRTGFAVTEPGAGSDLQGISTTAVKDGDDYIVTGTKTWITNARYADPLPVLVKTDPSATPRHRGMSFLLLSKDMDGFEVQRDIGKLGYKGPESCEITLDHVRVPARNLLGGVEGRGLQQALSALESGRINVAARAVGVAEASLGAALKYANEREAFGQTIGNFQAIQLTLADMATETQAARLLTWWAADQLDHNSRADMQTGMAKLFASEVALRASLAAMRVHGGYGYSTEFEVERYFRDAPLMAIGEGTSDILRTVIAKGILATGTDW